MMSYPKQEFGKVFHQEYYALFWSFGTGCESQTVGNPKYMGVYRHSCLVESTNQYHAGCFAAYARQGQQFVHSRRHLSVEFPA